jgi:hypothetical protein
MVALDDGWIPQHVVKRLVNAGHPVPESVRGRVEHTFGRLGEASDGKNHCSGSGALCR